MGSGGSVKGSKRLLQLTNSFAKKGSYAGNEFTCLAIEYVLGETHRAQYEEMFNFPQNQTHLYENIDSEMQNVRVRMLLTYAELMGDK